ncbi:MAG TPA: uroporphyrinogen-III synthase [Bacteroides sp.]|nr:uroporphyrinogen-III synthase [Phocaeicola coprophilus]HBB06920.1 uroporphyrinogen-III synthase [Bacteroides sp.]
MKIKKILVSQPKPTSEKSPYYDIANKYGVDIVFRPFIKVESVSAKEFRQQKVSILDYTAIVFTSRHAIDHFFHLCEELRVSIPETMKYFCVTESIALYIQKYVQYRKRKVFFGATGKIEDLIPSMVKHKAERYLVPMSDVHNDEVKNLLDKAKLQHTEVVMYRTVSNDFAPDEPFDYDMLIFFSPVGVAALQKNFPDFKQGDIAIGCFGPATAKAARDAGLRLDVEAPTPAAPSMTGALEMFLKDLK